MKKYQKMANVTEITFLDNPKKGIETNLLVKGYFGDPSWELLPEKIVYDKENRIVRIRIFARRDPKTITIQVIKEFEKEIPLIFQVGGEWIVRCNTESITIEVSN